MTFEEYWNGRGEKWNGKLDIKIFAKEVWEEALKNAPQKTSHNSEYKSPAAQSCLNCAEAVDCLPSNEACFKEKT